MPRLELSLRTSLGIAIIAMSLLCFGFMVVIAKAHQTQSRATQYAALQMLTEVKTGELLEKLTEPGIRLTAGLQSDPELARLILQRNATQIAGKLNQILLAIGGLESGHTVVINALDTKFNLLAESPVSGIGTPDCILMVAYSLVNPATSWCFADNGSNYISYTVPIGETETVGNIRLLLKSSSLLDSISEEFGIPLSITSLTGKLIYQSKNWPDAKPERDFIPLQVIIRDANSQPIASIVMAHAGDSLNNSTHTSTYEIATAGALIFIAAFFILFRLQKTTLSPLQQLATQLRTIREDKSRLGNQIDIQGTSDVNNLARDFNEMSNELSVLYKTLESMAFTDSLTGLPNRALFYDRLQQAALLAKRGNSRFALFVMDLDRFKYVNDTLGHHVGDQLLQEVSNRIQDSLRTSDTMARLGGDEFSALLPDVHSREDAVTVASKIVRALEIPIFVEGRHLSAGVSIGIVLAPDHGVESAELMQRADVAMYHAKQNTRGFTFYDSSLDEHSLFKLSLEGDLRKAIEHNTLELYFQPKVAVADGHTVGVEALLRWRHPERGYIPPDQFIVMAEETSLINPLTRWVLQSSLKQCAQWHRRGIKISVSVNLSARNLDDPTLVDLVRDTLSSSGISPEWLTLELTESALMMDPVHALGTLTRLSDLGIKIAIDDFGTGYSSLAYLKKLPVHEIKIDKSFVMDMHNDVNDAVIVRSTIDLAHNMGLSVIAEGVENQIIWDALNSLGCDTAQGFHMCRPVAAGELENWLRLSQWGWAGYAQHGSVHTVSTH